LSTVETVRELPSGVLAEPENGTGVGVLVLAGSSGRIDTDRARLLARHGATAMALRWFSGEGQPPGICEAPLETFTVALDRLARTNDRLGVVGVSKGAEAALLVAAHDTRVDVVAAFAPSHVAWANLGPGLDGRSRPYRSSWTLGGVPVPFVPYDDDWRATAEPPAFRGLYHASLARYPEAIAAATIPVERIRGDVIAVAGEDDQVWPSAGFARAIADRRSAHGRSTTVLTHPDAGHRTVLPGESVVSGGTAMTRGGTPQADAELGLMAWRALRDTLPLRLRA
jgi:dienelactone hydrolase